MAKIWRQHGDESDPSATLTRLYEDGSMVTIYRKPNLPDLVVSEPPSAVDIHFANQVASH